MDNCESIKSENNLLWEKNFFEIVELIHLILYKLHL